MVFSINTLAGFACSIGLDMGYNSHHHEHAKRVHKDSHTPKKGYNHNHPSHSGYLTVNATISNPGDDCCASQVTKFAQLDKSVVHTNLVLKAPIFPIISLAKFNAEEDYAVGRSVNSRFQFVRRSCSLDNTDIRIAIQSFQI